MARGMVVNEAVVSQASTDEFREAHERIWGDKPVQRGRWIWDEAAQKLVRAEDYQPPSRAVDAPIMVDRFYEGTAATDGTDIGSRRKHRDYMARNGLAPADDFSPGWYAKIQKDKERERKASRRDALGRALYKMDKP
jgi:hypothetical protein